MNTTHLGTKENRTIKQALRFWWIKRFGMGFFFP
jgi:hypothetical protein